MVASNWAKNSCFSRNSCFQGLVSLWILFFHQRRETPLNYSYAGHWTSRNHSRLYLSLFFCQKTDPGTFHAPVRTPWRHLRKNDALCSREYPQVYCVQKWSKSDWRFRRYSHFCIIPLSLKFLLFWPLSVPDHPAPETWQNWHQQHNNSSPSLPRQQQMPLPVHWQLGWHLSACQCTTGIPKMHTTPSPYFAIPWRTGSSSTAYHLTARTTSGMFLQP